jgi:hypothetical protein
MATAKRERVVQTTHPSISDGNSNRQTGGDMTVGVGSARTNTKIRKGVTPGSPVISNPTSRSYSAIADGNNRGLVPKAPKGAKEGSRN